MIAHVRGEHSSPDLIVNRRAESSKDYVTEFGMASPTAQISTGRRLERPAKDIIAWL